MECYLKLPSIAIALNCYLDSTRCLTHKAIASVETKIIDSALLWRERSPEIILV
ncbi:hypothetical protein [Nostoc sp. DSM 114161]|uniref:hypothetical protein n=1 Tax=Nostoc sp. DSM 114161 TaxID=3440143 RepID=UPI00404534F1